MLLAKTKPVQPPLTKITMNNKMMLINGVKLAVYIDNQLYNFVPVGTAMINVAIVK